VGEAGLAGALERDRRKSLRAARRVDISLDDLEERPVGKIRLVVVGARRAVEPATVVEAAIHVFQEVVGGDWRVLDVDRQVDVPERRLDADEHLF
jgi:hypothetical protein